MVDLYLYAARRGEWPLNSFWFCKPTCTCHKKIIWLWHHSKLIFQSCCHHRVWNCVCSMRNKRKMFTVNKIAQICKWATLHWALTLAVVRKKQVPDSPLHSLSPFLPPFLLPDWLNGSKFQSCAQSSTHTHTHTLTGSGQTGMDRSLG